MYKPFADTEYMKNFVRIGTGLVFFLCVSTSLFCQDSKYEIPDLLKGIWQNGNRIISFQQKEPAHIFLKLFYQWYYDRTAEPSFDVPERPRNDATSEVAEEISVAFEPIIEANQDSGAWNVSLYYPGFNETVIVPVAVFNGQMYIDFMIAFEDFEENTLQLQAASNASGITVNLPLIDKEVFSLFNTGNSLYKVRYWQTNMDYEQETQAVFGDSKGEYTVPKHLQIGKTTYTCVPGRGTRIRNIEQLPFENEGYTQSPDGRIWVSDVPYLTLLSEDIGELYTEVEEANSRQRPPRKPPLPRPDVDFHYDVIDELRKVTIIPMP